MKVWEPIVGLAVILMVLIGRGLVRWNFHYERKAMKRQRDALRLCARRWSGE